MSHATSSSDFVRRLEAEMAALFAQLEERETLEAESSGKVDVITLLKLALRSEVEAAEIAGLWMPTTVEIDAKMAFARQCGDEMKHYELICRRLRELGESGEDFSRLDEGYSPLYQYLRTLNTTVERVAAGPFAREAVAEVRNAQFIELCRALGDEQTAALYVDLIQPEEVQHQRLGRDLLVKYATTAELQALAASATRNSLAIADELRSLAQKATGLQYIPVS